MNALLILAAALALPGGGPLVIQGDTGTETVRKELPEPVTLEPGTVYGFSYSARSDAPVSVLAGTWFAALGTGEPGDGTWRRRQTLFSVPTRNAAFSCRVHFGQWRPRGSAEVKDVELVQLKSEYLAKDGLTLGGGERLDGNEYLYSFPFGRDGRSAARPLYSFECPFNGRLWWFSSRSHVTYRHDLSGRRFKRAKVFVGTSDWSGGKGAISVEVSPDGGKWHSLGKVEVRNRVEVELPDSMFPCESVFVRLSGSDVCDLQIAHYNLKATVDGTPVRIFGETRFIDTETGKVFAQVGRSSFDDDGYGETVADGDGVMLWSAPSGRKVTKTRPVPESRAKGLGIRVAANEAESVQLVVHAAGEIADVKVSLPDGLACSATGDTLPASALDVKRVGYVQVRHPTDFAGLPIAVPDKLLPMSGEVVPVAKGENQPFWITVRTPKNAKKGIYRGMIAVDVAKADGGHVALSVPLAVEVFGFALPDTMTCETAFGLTASLVAKAHHLEERTPAHRDVMERYLKAMAENRLSPYNPAFFDMWHVTWKEDVPSFDFSKWDRELERVFAKYHFNTFLVWLPGLGRCDYSTRIDPEFMGLKPDDPRYEKRLGAYFTAVNAHLKEKGWQNMAYVYPYDEPRKEDFDLVRNGFGFLAKHAPDMRRMLPSLSHDTFKELDGSVNLWCPQMHFISSPGLKPARERGERMWWYICNNPKAPYVCDFIDHAAPELRIWFWQTWKERVAGVLIWDAFNWREQTKHPDQNGEGRFLYPPEECAGTQDPVVADPVQSVRITHLRDGIEDYEYFAMLKRLDPQNPLLSVPNAVSASLTEFNLNTAELERHRLLVAREIERKTR